MKLPLIPPLNTREEAIDAVAQASKDALSRNILAEPMGEVTYAIVRPAAVEVTALDAPGKGMTCFSGDLFCVNDNSLYEFAEAAGAIVIPDPLEAYPDTLSGDFFDFTQSTL